MSRKSTILFALAAALTLGVATLSTSSADARGHGGGGGGHGGGGHGGGFSRVGGGHGGGFARHVGHHGGHHMGRHHHHFRHHHHHWRWYGYRRNFWYAPAVTYADYSVARPAVAGPCTCLSKEYTPEGAVLFKDRCTNEMAMNPPAQAPQQTSYQSAPVYQTAPQQPQTAYVPTYPPQAPVAR